MTTVNAVFFNAFIYHCYYKRFLFFSFLFLVSITDIATGYMADFRAALQLVGDFVRDTSVVEMQERQMFYFFCLLPDINVFHFFFDFK